MLWKCIFTVQIYKYNSYIHMTKHLSDKEANNSAVSLSLCITRLYISIQYTGILLKHCIQEYYMVL